MSTPLPEHNDLAATPETSSAIRGRSLWPAILFGLLPLTVLGVTVSATFVIVALTRQSIPASAFVAQQQADLRVLLIGSLIVLLAFALAVLFLLRRIARWQKQGLVHRARISLWLLVATAAIIVLPVVIAVLLPQQPAP